jgi:hypothetical protein
LLVLAGCQNFPYNNLTYQKPLKVYRMYLTTAPHAFNSTQKRPTLLYAAGKRNGDPRCSEMDKGNGIYLSSYSYMYSTIYNGII